MKRRSKWTIRSVITATAMSILLPTGGFSQTVTRNVFLPAPRPLRQHLNRARQALEEERYGDAVLEIAPVLLGSDEELFGVSGEPQDFFLEAENSGDAQKSIKSEAYRLLGSMPRRGIAIYELQFGADARALLEQAVKETSFEKLNSVVRKYYHTQAGYEAMVLLGRLHLDRGQPLAAALCFQRIIEAPAARLKFDPEVSVLLAVCWHLAGRPERASEALTSVKALYPEAMVDIGVAGRDSLPDASRALAWLREYFPDNNAVLKRPNEWLVHRGDPARNAAAAGGMPLRSLRWRAPTAEFPADEALIAEIEGGRRSAGESSVSSLSPIAVDNVIVMRSPDRMLAIDFTTGKRIWEYPWSDSWFPTVSMGRQNGTLNRELEFRKEQLQQRLWKDAPYGQISSDGSSVFLLDNLRFTPMRANFSPIPRLAQGNTNWPRQNNQLVALDLGRQGALKWMVGGDSGLGEPELAGAFFLGAPLPMMGQLFGLAEVNGEIRLVVLDSETGRQQWSQQLAHVDAVTILSNPHRRLMGASPSFGDGILVCPTSAGAVVAIELASRSLLWGYQYAPVNVQRNRLQIQRIRQSAAINANPWLDATATISDGTVVLTPAESDQLYCLDLLTGNPRWPAVSRSGEFEDLQFVACVHRGRIVLVGKHGAHAIGLADGQPAWSQPVSLDEEQGEMVSGRGFQTGRYYYLPTTASRLLKIDLEEGQIVEETITDQTLGNLICYRDEVISQGTDFLATYYQFEPLQRKVDERLRETPDDPWALARRGELLINSGDLGAAIDSLRQAYELQEDDVAVRSLLVKTLLRGLQEEFTDYRPVAAELEQLIDRPGQRMEYLRLMASGLRAAGDLPGAAKRFFQLIDFASDDVRGQPLSSLGVADVDSTTTARLDRWITVQLDELSRSADSELQAWLTAQVAQRWDQAAPGSIDDIERFLAFFAFHPSAAAARVDYVGRLAEQGRLLEAELSVFRLAQSGATPHAVSAAAQAATTLNRLGKQEAASRFFRLLQTRWSDETDVSGATGAAHLAELGPTLDRMLTPANRWNWGAVTESKSTGRPRQLPTRPVAVPIRHSRNDLPGESFLIIADGRSDVTLTISDSSGRVVLEAPVTQNPRRPEDYPGLNYAFRSGHLLVAALADTVVAVDMFGESDSEDSTGVLWSDEFAQRLSPSQIPPKGDSRRGNPFDPLHPETFFVEDASGKPVGTLGPANTHGVVLLKSRALTCVDPVNGQTLWTRTNVERGSEVFGDDEYIFVAADKSRSATVLNAIDGSLVGVRSIPPNRWTAQGRRILAWEMQDDSPRLFLYDAWQESDIWSESFANGSRGHLSDSTVAIAEPTGRFQIRDLDNDRIEVEAELQPEESLRAIYLQSSLAQHLLITDRKADSQAGRPVIGGLPAPLIRGRIYAFDRASGKKLWQSPAEIEDMGLPLHQPASVPTLWLLRQQRPVRASRNRNAARRIPNKASILCLDRRDGRVLLARNDAPISTSAYAIESDPENQTVRLMVPGNTFELEFTNQEIAPEPPLQSEQALRQAEAAAEAAP